MKVPDKLGHETTQELRMHEQARSSKINHRTVASSCVKSTKCLKHVFGDTQHPSLLLRKNYNPHKWQIHEQVWQVSGWSSLNAILKNMITGLFRPLKFNHPIPPHRNIHSSEQLYAMLGVPAPLMLLSSQWQKRKVDTQWRGCNCTCQTVKQVPKYKHLLEHTTKMVNDLNIFHHLLGVIVWSCGHDIWIHEWQNSA